MLANIVLHDLDMELERRGHKFVRYADDFLVLVKSERAGQRVMAGLTQFLNKVLRLTVNQTKSKVAKLDQCRFLGFTFRRKKIVWSEKFQKLGVSERQAVMTALSRKSYWHLSRTMATQWGLNDAWLKSQGLVSMRDLWIAFHYPAASQSGKRVASR